MTTRTDIAGAVREALRIGMVRDERHVVVQTAAARAWAGAAWSDELARDFGAARVRTLPAGPDTVVGIAIGLGAGGLRPVVALGPGEDERALHQLVQLGRARQRVQARLSTKVTVRAPLRAGSEALYARCPGLRVVAPSSPREAKGLFLGALRTADPVVVLEPADDTPDDVPEANDALPIGTANLCHGDPADADAVVLAYGRAVGLARRAADALAADGVRVAVLDVRSLHPLDEAAIVAAASAAGRCVIVADAPLGYGIAAELVAVVERAAFASLRAPVVRVGAPDVPPPTARLEPYYLPRAEAVIDAVRTVLGAKPAALR